MFDTLLHMCRQLSIMTEPGSWPKTYAAVSSVCSRWRSCAQHDLIWKPACERRWNLQLSEVDYMTAARDAAEAAGANRQTGGSSNEGATELPATWMAHYVQREKSIIDTLPVFFMGGNLQAARPFGLHLFEPRYRRLIAKARERDGDPQVRPT